MWHCDTVSAWPERFTLVDDLSEFGWIQLDPWVEGPGSVVTSVVPKGFAAYVRVFHPASVRSGSDEPVRWSEVARTTGRTMYPLAQWKLVSGEVAGPRWREPDQGEPPREVLLPLVSALRPFTSTPDRCLFAIWDGLGVLHMGSSNSLLRREYRIGPVRLLGRTAKAPHTRRDHVIAQREAEAAALPRFEFEPYSGRPYFLGSGPLDVVLEVTDDSDYDRPGVPVAMWWPEDRSWFVASKIDFDSTIIGGSADLRDALLSDERLEALEVPPEGILSDNGDTVNQKQ